MYGVCEVISRWLSVVVVDCSMGKLVGESVAEVTSDRIEAKSERAVAKNDSA